MTDGLSVRRAREADIPALAPLVHLPAERMYEQLAPSRARALRIVEADLRRGTVNAAWVVEVGGVVAGAMVAFPYREGAARARAFVRTALRRTPPWRWPRIARVFLRGHRSGLRHEPDSLYVDGLGVSPSYRRRGVAVALLEHAASTAANNGLRSVTLDTAETNSPAMALYRRCGFEVSQVVPARPPVPAIVGFRKALSDRGCS